MKYEPIGPRSLEELSRELGSGDPSQILRAIISAALHHDDRHYVESLIIDFSSHPDPWVRGACAIATGHVARIHRALTSERIVPIMQRLLQDENPRVRSEGQYALDDITMFLSERRSG